MRIRATTARSIMTPGQYQQPAGAQTGQTIGQTQHGATGSRGGAQQGMGHQSQQGMSRQSRQGMGRQSQQLADGIARAVEVCGWCADQCVQESNPQMVECIRLCHDVTEIGETALAMLPRNSQFGQSIVQTLQQAVQACAQECGQHDRGHCQECAQVLGETLQTLQQGAGSGMQAGTQGMGQHGGTFQGF